MFSICRGFEENFFGCLDWSNYVTVSVKSALCVNVIRENEFIS